MGQGKARGNRTAAETLRFKGGRVPKLSGKKGLKAAVKWGSPHFIAPLAPERVTGGERTDSSKEKEHRNRTEPFDDGLHALNNNQPLPENRQSPKN